MDHTNLLTTASALVATLFGLLTVVIGWMGSRVISKQDETIAKIEAVKDELHQKITNLDSRVVRIETILDKTH